MAGSMRRQSTGKNQVFVEDMIMCERDIILIIGSGLGLGLGRPNLMGMPLLTRCGAQIFMQVSELGQYKTGGVA
jgi:hypothetical protein